MSKKPCFRRPLGPLDNKTNGSKHCCNLNNSSLTKFINHCEGGSIEKKFVLVIRKILSLFVNTLTVHEKHYFLPRDNLTQTIHIQLSEKQKAFFQFFLGFLKSLLNFKHLSKKNDPRSWCISGNTGSEKYAICLDKCLKSPVSEEP